MKDIKIIIATHKNYRMPNDKLYLPLHVGAEGKKSLGYKKDNEGIHISEKNKNFCELTGLYWAWKNLDNDYVGLVHYRRHFGNPKMKNKDPFMNIVDYNYIDNLLNDTDIILTKKRNYYIETIYNHYAHTMYVEPLDETRKIIEEKYPDYLSYFDKHMHSRSQHAFNMFVMKKSIFDDYCDWLFDILFELENRYKDVEYDAFHARFYGRISERLLDVWLNKNGHKYKELPFIYTEPINKVKKITSFLNAKFCNKKYDGSF